jgi:aldehyde:ferredoxin oxidoreductase
MEGGFTGRGLVIHLDREEAEDWAYPREYPRLYLGGFGVNNKIFEDWSEPGAHPLSPGNPVVLGAGPFVGTLVPGSARVMATSRLPLTGAVASASGSMGLGAHMKWAGWDHVVILGRAERPCVVVIEDSKVKFHPAGELWGKGIFETTRCLWEDYPGYSVTAIGPGGERGVHISLAIIDGCATLGRGGLGAVLGSKNVKALLVRGSGGVKAADMKRLRALVRGLYERLRAWPMREGALELGMIGAWGLYAAQLLPHGAGPGELQEVTERFGPDAYLGLKKGRLACPSCFLGDKDELRIPGWKDPVYSTSFLNAAIIGCAFLMGDAEEAASTLALLDDLGLDFMSLSNMAAYLLELREHGVIRSKELEGIPLVRGGEILRELARALVRGEGEVSRALAEGWKGALEYFGEHTRRFTILVRNQDCLYDPRVSGMGTMEFEQVVSPRGPTSATGGSATYLPGLPLEKLERLTRRMGAGDEAVSRIFSPPRDMNVGRLTRYSEDWFSLFSSLGICNRHQVNRFYHAGLIRDLLQAVTGMDLEVGEMMEKAAAAWGLYRGLNAEVGLGREEDVIPEAWFDEKPLWGRGGRLHDYFGRDLDAGDVDRLLEDYYDERSRGWG